MKEIIKKYLTKKELLTDNVYLNAANLNDDGKISINDIIMVVESLSGNN